MMLIRKALYGLKTSGKRWAKRLIDVLRDIGFSDSKANPSIWMCRAGDHYEYIAVYVDDLCISSKNPKEITDVLIKEYGFKLKGVGQLRYHLGTQFDLDPDGTMAMSATWFIKKIMLTYERHFGKQYSRAYSPLEKNDHPETDTSQELNQEHQGIYQSMIGELQ